MFEMGEMFELEKCSNEEVFEIEKCLLYCEASVIELFGVNIK